MTAPSRAPSTPDDARYQIERKLGEGTAGAVYLVRDRETGEQLALKKLFRMDAKSVLRLKREFRSLQAVNHPHIVKLYDMGQAGDAWFLTMEYLEGADLSRYLDAEAEATVDATGPDDAAAALLIGPRLLPAFRQLARGIHTLHEAGMLHRDLKPSNVLVVDHRVVVLDFGLVRELHASDATLTEDGSVAGTPAYMAPEQIAARELSAATDWYAFGVMLYEAISGLLPFDGSLMDLLRAKLESDPVPLEQLVPEVPRWLSELCNALLKRNPAERPSGADVLSRLDAARTRSPLPCTGTDHILPTEVEVRSAPSPLFGRTRELTQLWRAFGQAQEGCTVVLHVRGVSGSGKSAVVEQFLDQLASQGSASSSSDTLVLRSRCYELEATPFKALDAVMDVLTRHLSRLDDFNAAHLLPADVGALAQVFPVLERLNAVKRLLSTHKPTQDALQLRRRAEAALRALLSNLAAQTPIVLWIDDLQWGDLDSAGILKSWLSQPSDAPLFFVFSYRSDEIATSTCLRKLLQDDGEHASQAPEYAIDMTPLAAAEVEALCKQRLPPQTAGRAELIARVVREAQGSPFLASQLIALANAKSARGDTDLQSLSIDLMVAQISALLAEDAQRLLAVMAVAGRPVSPRLVLQAAGIQRGGRALVHDLRALSLVRTRDVAGVRMLEVYHDRIRERVQSGLSAAQSRLIHQQLFDTLELSGEAEPDWLHTLALGAGQDSQAAHYGKAAAERAGASLAFERAAGLYRKCIELVPSAEAGELWSKLALALARCGRGVDAAEASLEAAKHAPAEQKLAWMHRAASHLLRSGHFERGEALVREVLEAKGLGMPTSDAGLSAAITWERAWIKLRGTSDVLRPAEECPPELLERFDLLTSLFIDTHIYDPVRATLYQVRSLRCALEAGEPTRLVRALGTASIAAALLDSAQAGEESDALLARAAAINKKLAAPDEQFMNVTRAVNAFGLGRLHDALGASQAAGRMIRADSQDDPSENYARRGGMASVRISTLQFLGEYRVCASELQTLLEEASATGNRVFGLRLTRNQTLADQIAGHAAKSRPRLDAQSAELPTHSFGLLHVTHMVAVMSSACWTGDYAWANAYLESAWAKFLRSPVRHAAYLGLMAYAEHAHLLLNQHLAEPHSGKAARVVRTDVRALEKMPLPWAAAFAQRFRARVAFLDGDRAAANAQLRLSASTFQEIGMAHETARDQAALGALLAGEEGSALCTAAERRMREMGVADPQADLRSHYPELFKVR
jgi:eukaryotic-like serine/threonine-protein kinase